MLLFSSFLISGIFAASASIQFNKPKIKEGEQLIVSCELSGFGADVKCEKKKSWKIGIKRFCFS